MKNQKCVWLIVLAVLIGIVILAALISLSRKKSKNGNGNGNGNGVNGTNGSSHRKLCHSQGSTCHETNSSICADASNPNICSRTGQRSNCRLDESGKPSYTCLDNPGRCYSNGMTCHDENPALCTDASNPNICSATNKYADCVTDDYGNVSYFCSSVSAMNETLICPSGTCTECSKCKAGYTCKEGTQTFMTDCNCQNPSTDKHGGLGCGAFGEQTCRFCGFGAFADVPCTGVVPPPPPPPPHPVDPCGTFACENPPDYNLPACPSNAVACINILNKCPNTIWALGSVDAFVNGLSPTNGDRLVLFYYKLESGQKQQYSIPSNLAPNKTMYAARIYLYYKDPATINDPQYPYLTNPNDPTSGRMMDSDPSQGYNQITEFTLDVDKSTGNRIIDYDISSVDSFALPVYMSSGKNCGDGCKNQECASTYSLCSPTYATDNCPTKVINKDSITGIGQCQGAYQLCLNPENKDNKICHTYDQYKDFVSDPNVPYYAANPSLTILGCSPAPGHGFPIGRMSFDACRSLALGICQDPNDPSKCPVADWDNPTEWFNHGLPQNNYSKFVNDASVDIYSGPAFEGVYGGNKQCIYPPDKIPQINLVVCPSCGDK